MSEELKAKLKQAGLNAAEDFTKLAFDHVKQIGQMLVDDTANPFDDVAFKGLLMLESEVNKLIDKIDGQEG